MALDCKFKLRKTKKSEYFKEGSIWKLRYPVVPENWRMLL